jgi:hypothetical protein
VVLVQINVFSQSVQQTDSDLKTVDQATLSIRSLVAQD